MGLFWRCKTVFMLLCVVSVLVGCGRAVIPCTDPTDNPECRATLDEIMARAHVPAVSVVVLQNFRVVEQWAVGTASLDLNRSISVTTPFQAGDLSMPVTALGVLAWLQDSGGHLDLVVNEGLADWQIADRRGWSGNAVTLRDLLSHRHGLSPTSFRGYAVGEMPPTWSEMLTGQGAANSAPVLLASQPGENCDYSAAGYEVLAYWLEQQSDWTFSSWQNIAVFTPLNIPARYQLIGLPSPALGHDWRGEVIPGGFRRYHEHAAKGLWATPTDLARIVLEVMATVRGQGRIITDPDLVSALLSPQGCRWGLGWSVERRGSETEFSLRGSTAGYRTFVLGQTRSGNGVVVMANGDRGDRVIEKVVAAVRRDYGW